MTAISAVGVMACNTGSSTACKAKESATGCTQRASGTTPLNLVNHGHNPCAIPSSIHSRISSPEVTASFQR